MKTRKLDVVKLACVEYQKDLPGQLIWLLKILKNILKAATQNTVRWFSEDCVEIQKLVESQNQPSSQ